MAGDILAAEEYFNLSKSYYDVYFKLNDEIDKGAGLYTEDQLIKMNERSDQVLLIAREYRARFNKNITTDIKTSVKRINASVKEAADAIHDLRVVGAVIDVIGDLVVVGGTVLESVTRPSEIAKLPGLIKNLIEDVKKVKTA